MISSLRRVARTGWRSVMTAVDADACWALTGPGLFLDLTTGRGWQSGLYEDWLTRMLTANLLTPASHAPASSQRDAT
jgi:hypothetical protein